jgi:hypothetical protein
MASAGLLFIAPGLPQSQGQGKAVITVLPKNDGKIAPDIFQKDLQSVKVNGKEVKGITWQSLRSLNTDNSAITF